MASLLNSRCIRVKKKKHQVKNFSYMICTIFVAQYVHCTYTHCRCMGKDSSNHNSNLLKRPAVIHTYYWKTFSTHYIS